MERTNTVSFAGVDSRTSNKSLCRERITKVNNGKCIHKSPARYLSGVHVTAHMQPNTFKFPQIRKKPVCVYKRDNAFDEKQLAPKSVAGKRA